MIFSAATFLYLIPLAGLPVVFHLIFKQKRRTFVFSTLMFFHRTDPRLNSRRKIRQWLLLMTRILLVLFVLLALSRPVWRSRSGTTGTRAAVVVIDNSGSMSADASGGKTKLHYAIEGADKLISSLRDGSEAALITLVDDPMVPAYDALSDNTEMLSADIGRVRPTQAAGDAQKALLRAVDLLKARPVPGGVVHVFTDLQSNEWANGAIDIKGPSKGLSVYFHRIVSSIMERANAAIVAIEFPEEKILPQHTYSVSAVLQNRSDSPADIRLKCIDDMGRQNTEAVLLRGAESSTVELQVGPYESGYHWVRIWLEGDGFEADNEAYVGLFCSETTTALFAGAAEEFGVLPLALSPSRRGQYTGIAIDLCAPAELKDRIAEEAPILVVLTWGSVRLSSQDQSWLQEYVQAGGNLLIVPSTSGATGPIRAQEWIGAGTGDRSTDKQGLALRTVNTQAIFWDPVRKATSGSGSPHANAYIFIPLELATSFTPLLGIGPADVVFAHRELGKGNVYVSGTAFDPRWNTLPQTPLAVIMAQRAATGGAAETDTVERIVAGEPPEGTIAESNDVEIVSLVGDSVEWRGPGNQLPGLPKAGVYLLRDGEDTLCLSVRAADTEGSADFVAQRRFAGLGIEHEVLDYDPPGDFEQYHMGAGMVGLYLPLLLLATLALIAEGLLGNLRSSKLPSARTEAVSEDAVTEGESHSAVGRTVGDSSDTVVAGRGAAS